MTVLTEGKTRAGVKTLGNNRVKPVAPPPMKLYKLPFYCPECGYDQGANEVKPKRDALLELDVMHKLIKTAVCVLFHWGCYLCTGSEGATFYFRCRKCGRRCIASL